MKKQTRKINRLQGYDYSQNGAYFVTICTHNRENPSPTLGNIVGWFKYQTTIEINFRQNNLYNKIWQRSYHDHIIRNEKEYLKIWNYIYTNTLKWREDLYYTKNCI